MKIMRKLLFMPLIIALGAVSTNTYLLIILLFGSTLLDFITGIIASYVEDKKVKRNYKAYFIQSNRMRESIVKSISYMFLIILTRIFCIIFAIPAITIPVVGIVTTLTTLAFTICISIETYSIFENLKRSGFDIFGELRKVLSKIASAVKYLSNFKNMVENNLK